MHDARDGFAAAIDRIVADEENRRELLWLRAREKDDDVHARRLVGGDPSLPLRLRYLHGVDFDAIDALDPRRREHVYAALFDDHLDWLLGREGSDETRLERRRVTRARLG